MALGGRYLFPIPPEAVLSRFEAKVDGHDQAVTRQDSTTTDAERTMHLEYEEALAPRGGLYRYRYVLSTERYSSLPLEAASITVEVSASPGLASLYSPSHDVAVDRLRPAGGEALRDARGYVGHLAANGSTDLEAALQAALQILDRSENRGVPRLVVFLTDGLSTAGITDEAAIARRTVTYVQPGENLEVRLTEFYGTIAHPLLTGLEVEFGGMEVSEVYQALPDLFQGSSLLLSGRYRAGGDAVTVRVRGRAGEEVREYVYHFDLAASGADRLGSSDFAARLWATRRVGALLDRVRVDGESETLASEVRELGLRYGIVTPYTTFVVEARTGGAASAVNMDLYGRVDLTERRLGPDHGPGPGAKPDVPGGGPRRPGRRGQCVHLRPAQPGAGGHAAGGPLAPAGA